MNNKFPMTLRMLLSSTFLILLVGMLTTTKVQSADPLAINATITVSPTSGLVTTEAGVSDTFTVTLSQEPLDTVTVNLTSSNTNEGTVSPSAAVFNSGAGNWDPVLVTVTGVDDLVDDGNVGYTITTAQAISTDPAFNIINPDDVSVTNNDDDTAGFTITPLTAMQTTELAGTASFNVALSSQPTDTVTVAVSSNDGTEGLVTAPLVLPLTFTTANWNSPQTITVTGQNDDIDDGDVPYAIVLDPASTGDTVYNTLANFPVALTNLDDTDTAGLTVVPTPPMQTTESGGTATFTVALSSQPTDTVTVALSSNDGTEGVVTSPLAPLSFTTGNWSTPQPVVVTGLNDPIVDGNIPYNIILNPSSILDTTYNALPNVLVAVTNMDNDTAGLTVVSTPPMQTTEAGGTATFTVALSTQPTADVTVAVSSNNTNEGVVSAPAILPLTFTTATWNNPQQVTITGVDDSVVDNNVGFNIVLNPDSLTDTNYSGLPDTLVPVTNLDRLSVVSTPPMYTTEGEGEATFNIALSRQPASPVTISLSTDTPTEAIITEPDSIPLSFTTLNWNIPKKITVTGVDDCFNDGDVPYKLILTISSPDPNFQKVETLNLINYDAPTIAWVKPVGNDEIYFSDGFSKIELEVINLCPAEPIDKVRFYRYVPPPNEDWITIGEDEFPPYRAEILPEDLEPLWNQIFAFAWEPPNGVQTTSKHERILILNEINTLIVLPYVTKNY